MLQLILGLVLFIGTHSLSIFALNFRNSMAARSALGWKAIYSLASLAGLVLIVRGYGELRMTPTVLYVAPKWTYHLVATLMLPVFILFFAPYFPGRISRAAKHPQLVAVKLWALSHLLVNGMLADVILFGVFLAWAVVNRISLKRREARPVPGLPASNTNDIILVVLGLIAYGAFVMHLHEALIGVNPLMFS